MAMSKFHRFVTVVICLSSIVLACATVRVIHQKTARNVALAPLFTDNMVLQQGKPCPIWGTGEPGGMVIVKLAGQEEQTTVGADGHWRVTLTPPAAGGPYTLQVNDREIRNVLVGEVWVCSGQSNMEFQLRRANNAKAEIEAANYPQIRLFTVQRNTAPVPIDSIITDGWQVCSPQSIADFSAVAYFFGRYLHQQLQVPVGLIHTSWGGTPAESWTSQATLKMIPDFAPRVTFIQEHADSLTHAYVNYLKSMELYREQQKVWMEKVLSLDKGTHETIPWFSTELNDDAWKTMHVPTKWESQHIGLDDFDGVVWFRKHITIPNNWVGQPLTLNMGPIDDADVTWFNGVEVGNMHHAGRLRTYKIPGSIVRAGDNVLAVRVMDVGGHGGFGGESQSYNLTNEAGEALDITGDWAYTVSVNLMNVPRSMKRPRSPGWMPSFLYNAMIHPLIPYGIQGAIWYQGESNASRAYQYRYLFPAMIADWRRNWGQGDFPFYFVQLANFMAVKPEPAEDTWAELREAQTMALALPNTGMAVIIDIGEADDIHPKNKQDVGKRLALNALAQTYGKDIPYSGPMYQSMQIEGDNIRLTFNHVYDGLKAKGGKLTGFAIAGEDRHFVWADAVIDGNTVVVSSPAVPNPVAVRYGWASNPVCNLYNSAGLPASPFRTDSWPGITVGRK